MPNGSAPASDISIHDLDSRAGVIAAQTGYPAGLAYTSALQEAKQHGAQTVDGDSIDDAIAGVWPVTESQLTNMPGPQLRQAFETGLITRQQLITAVPPRNAPANQSAAAADDEDGDPLAQSIAELTGRATDLRNKIQTAFDTGGADGIRSLATYRAALANTEDRLHASTQSLLNRMPMDMQKRIANAVAPNVDWNDAAVENAQDPMTHFATENIGSALRDQSMPPYLQLGIRKFAVARGVNPDIADHIAHQALGASAVSDLLLVLRGADIDPGRAETLQDMGLLQPSDPNDPTSPLHLTEDAQRLLPPGAQRFVQIRPDFARYTPSPDPAHGSALYQNAVAGMQRFSDTAEKTLPPAPSTPDTDPSKAAPIAPDIHSPHGFSAQPPSHANIIPGLDDSPTELDGGNSPNPNANDPGATPEIIPGLQSAFSSVQPGTNGRNPGDPADQKTKVSDGVIPGLKDDVSNPTAAPPNANHDPIPLGDEDIDRALNEAYAKIVRLHLDKGFKPIETGTFFPSPKLFKEAVVASLQDIGDYGGNMRDLDTSFQNKTDFYTYHGDKYPLLEGKVFSGPDLNYLGVGAGFAARGIPRILAKVGAYYWKSAKYNGKPSAEALAAEEAGWKAYWKSDAYFNSPYWKRTRSDDSIDPSDQ